MSLHPLAPNLIYQQVKLDFELAGLLSFGRQFMDPALRPLRITVRGPAPPYAARYAEIFDCPVEFDSEHHSITFSRRDLDRPLTSANPLARILAQGTALLSPQIQTLRDCHSRPEMVGIFLEHR